MVDSGETREDRDTDRDEREDEPRDEEQSASGDEQDDGSSDDEQEDGSSDDEDLSEAEAAQRAQERHEKAQEKMEELEEMDEPPVKLEDWPEDQAKYVTFGGPEGEHSYSEGPEEKLGKANLERKADGSVLIEGEEVDNPDEYKAEPVAGGPTDPDTASLPGETRKLEKMREQDLPVPQAAEKAQEQRKERGTAGEDEDSDEESDSDQDSGSDEESDSDEEKSSDDEEKSSDDEG